MAVGIVDRQKLVNIADAVRAKKGITGNMTLDAIASNITSMPTADNNAKFDFAGSGSKSEGNLLDYLTTVDLSNLDTSNYTNMSRMFQYCKALKNIDVSGFNTSKVTDMSNMFNGCWELTSLDLSNWNTSKVTDMNDMFSMCSSLTTLNFSNSDTSKVTNMNSMFSNCTHLTSLDLSSFNTTNVTNMNFMFNECHSLTSLDLSNFDTSNVTNMMWVFHNCNFLTSLNLSNWNTSKVTNMNDMFGNCSKLSNLTLGNDWASNSSISSFSLSSCPLTHESSVDVINKLATRSDSPVITFSSDVGLYQSEIDVATNKGWSVSGCIVLVEDPTTATVGQGAIIDGVVSKCIYVADTPQDWGQRIFSLSSEFIDSNGNSRYQWGGNGTSTGIYATDIGAGLTNTNALLAMNLQSTDGTPTVWDALAEFRSTYGDRWFIPSRNEGRGYDEKTETWTSSEGSTSQAYINKGNVINHLGYKSSSYPFAPFTYV